ncbi:MAG TPA: HD domain-containing protein [Firmicutes bacterium]|jgi:tRNA nucleotidyltransferase (CCA-adding enzyme)|nr:HD domain-containing protein [Bacillota bacterium]
MDISPPVGALDIVQCLQQAGHQAVFVGGCVRDLLLGIAPTDWDVATSARPEQVRQLFAHTVPVGIKFGTVMVLNPEAVEVTTFRRDLGSKNSRHPVQVLFTDSLTEDLARRDFTINALAWDPITDTHIDPFGGRADLTAQLVRAVGDPMQRFYEDALRILRAVRFACRLDFDIESETWDAVISSAYLTDRLSKERVRDELLKILAVPDPGRGLWMLNELGILQRIIPELRGSERLAQGKRGAPTLLDHLIQTAAACPEKPLLRLAGLLHDIGKLTTRQITSIGRVVFHGHTQEGARIAGKVMRRLCFDSKSIAYAQWLVQNHMHQGEISRKVLRRWLSAQGETWIRDLLALRKADHIASGGSDAPALSKAEADLDAILANEQVLKPSDLAVDGHDIMKLLQISPGPAVGQVLARLYEHILENPADNNRASLLDQAERLWADKQHFSR